MQTVDIVQTTLPPPAPSPEPFDELDEQPTRLWNTREEHIALCESGRLPLVTHLTGDGGIASRCPWCNDAGCAVCGPYLAGKIRERTEEYLETENRNLWRVVIPVTGDYDKFRDKLNRFINQAGARKELYPMDDHIIIHLDRWVDFTSYGQVAIQTLTDDVPWLAEINTSYRKSGNMRVEKENEEDAGLTIHTDRFTVESDPELASASWAAAIVATDIALPVYTPDLSLSQIMLIQSAYDARNAAFRQIFEANGGTIHGVTLIRVSYSSWGNYSNQLGKGRLAVELLTQELTMEIHSQMPGQMQAGGRDRD